MAQVLARIRGAAARAGAFACTVCSTPPGNKEWRAPFREMAVSSRTSFQSRALFGSALLCCIIPAAQASLFLAFTPDPARAGSISPEGCYTEPGLARGLLTSSSTETSCHNGQLGSFDNPSVIAGQAPSETVALFATGELSSPLSIRGPATLVAYHNVASGAGSSPNGEDLAARLDYALREKHPAGHWTTIASGTAFVMPPGGGRGEVTFDFPPYTLSPGGRLQVLLLSPNAPEARLFFGGAPLIDDVTAGNAMYYASYSDAGITMNAGNDGDDGGTLGDVAGGATPVSLLLPLLLARGRRRLRMLMAVSRSEKRD
jgi:hypothetical protein